MNSSRWRWTRRPRWAVVLVALGLFVGWWLWPIELYEVVGRVRGYEITLPDSSETSGGSIGVMVNQVDPWSGRRRLVERTSGLEPVDPVSDLGDLAAWIEVKARSGRIEDHLYWSRGNVIFLLRARTLEGHQPGTGEWRGACERVARETDARFLEGEAGSYKIRAHRIPRVIVRARSAWDAWQLKRGREPRGWWQDW